jgi:hypothetical protein
MGAQGVGALINTAGAYSSSVAQKNAQKYGAHVDRLNAAAAELQAQDALKRGMVEMHKVSRVGRQVLAKQQVAFAANGVDITEGSPLAILDDTAYFSEVDVATTRGNSEKEAWASRVRGSGLLAEASLKDYAASTINPRMTALGTALGGSGQVASSWYSMKR